MPADDFGKLRRADWLFDEVDRTDGGGQLPIAGDTVRRDRDDRNVAGREVALLPARPLPPLHSPPLNVPDDPRPGAGFYDLPPADLVDGPFVVQYFRLHP